MKISKNIHLKLLNIVFLIGFLNFETNACSCDPIPFQEAVKYADEIFVGKIIKAEKFKNETFINSNRQEEVNWDWRYYFQIRKKWKGNNNSELIIHHEGTSCDFWFDIYQKEYLVYASRKPTKRQSPGLIMNSSDSKESLSTWLCSRTISNQIWKERNWFKEDVKKLEKEFPNNIELKSTLNTIWFLISGILILLIGFYLLQQIKR